MQAKSCALNGMPYRKPELRGCIVLADRGELSQLRVLVVHFSDAPKTVRVQGRDCAFTDSQKPLSPLHASPLVHSLIRWHCMCSVLCLGVPGVTSLVGRDE